MGYGLARNEGWEFLISLRHERHACQKRVLHSVFPGFGFWALGFYVQGLEGLRLIRDPL